MVLVRKWRRCRGIGISVQNMMDVVEGEEVWQRRVFLIDIIYVNVNRLFVICWRN